jgi:hypothetical protein
VGTFVEAKIGTFKGPTYGFSAKEMSLFPFIHTRVQMPNLSLIETKRITAQFSWDSMEAFCTAKTAHFYRETDTQYLLSTIVGAVKPAISAAMLATIMLPNC